MAEREYRRTPDWPEIQTPLTGDELAEIWQDGEQRQGPLSVLGGVPSAHAASHKFGGTDVVGTQDKTANAIPITDGSGTLDVFVSDASTIVKGKVQLATDGESAAGKAMQSNDARATNARTPTAHAASHLGGSDTLGLGSAAFLNSGAANGVCPLNASSQVDSGYLPSYVDAVIEVANFAALPVTGESGKIYVTLDDNLTYRWSGSAYVEISKSLALGETSSTAYRGDRGKTAYDHSQATGNPHGTAISDISTLTGKITPLSNLNRVFHLTGNGIPMLPDNVAEATFKQDYFSSIPSGWNINSGSPISYFIAGVWRIEANTVGEGYYYNTTASKAIIMFRVVSGTWSIGLNLHRESYTANGEIIAPFARTTDIDFDIFCTSSTGAIEVYTIYIGSGLFDTPVYDNAGNNTYINHGVLSVPGRRGNDLLFMKSDYLESSKPIFGSSGTFSFERVARDTNRTEWYYSELSYTSHRGIGIYRGAGDYLYFMYGNGSSEVSFSLGVIVPLSVRSVFSIVVGETEITVYRNGIFENIVSIGGTIQPSTGGSRIGCSTAAIEDLVNGILGNLRIDSRIWTQDDVTRYHNGDDAVDSQQKAQTPIPYSIMTRKSDGRTEVANAVDQLDAINKGQLDAACADLLYQTYTAGSTFTAGQLGYLHTDGKVYLYDANAEASAKGALYIAVSAITANNVGTFQRGGEYTTTGLSAGAIYYGSETPGAITTTAPTTSGAIVRKIGFAQSSTVLFFNPSNDYVVLV